MVKLLENLGPNATDLNPFDENVTAEILGGTTEPERAGNDPTPNRTIENTLDAPAQWLTGVEPGRTGLVPEEPVIPGDGPGDGPLEDAGQAINVLLIVALLFAVAKFLESGTDLLGEVQG